MKKYHLLICLFLFLCSSALLKAGTKPGTKQQIIRVGVCYAPPFVITGEGPPMGVMPELWRQVADSLDLNYQYYYFNDLKSLLEAIQQEKIDISLYPLSATSERLSSLRFTIPIYISELSVLNRPAEGPRIGYILQVLITRRNILYLFGMLPVLIIFSILIWIFERHKNQNHFRRSWRGIWDGIWWAFVTMTTVGYGDKAPKSYMGKVVTIMWMFIAITMFFLITGVISSELTLSRLQSSTVSIEELKKVRVGTVSKSGYSEMLTNSHIPFTVYPAAKDGIVAVSSGALDAFVFDKNVMNYILIKNHLQNSLVVRNTDLADQYFCLGASKNNHGLIDMINPVLIHELENNTVRDILKRYGLNP